MKVSLLLNLNAIEYATCEKQYKPIVHIEKESGGRIVELIAQNFLQLTDELIVICGAHPTELLQQ